MEQYISKSALVAEINKRLHQLTDAAFDSMIGRNLIEIRDSIDTLETKEVDLNEEICTFFSKNPIPYEHITDWPLLKNCAIHFFELGLNTAQKGDNNEL